jgi:hypothetical protein
MPNDLEAINKLNLTFTTLEIRIIEHLVAASIADRCSRRQALLKRPSSRTRESDAEFEMALEPLQRMREKISAWLNARRAT